ncbi:MAG: nucleotidyltransferase family protein [Candidatus Omnitrophota bacterium]|nr:nucleotidyltransferase family protein [Candidatus Omnitrophota bacterium]
MRVLILAAGYGTRLYPLTLNLPKSLVPIGNKPLMNFLIEKINDLEKNFSIEEMIVVSNNKFYNDFLDWKKRYQVNAKIVNDGSNSPQDRLGAVKDIKFAIGGRKDDWLILGGDNLFEDNLKKFIDFSLKKKFYPCVGLYDVKEKKLASRYGVVKVDSQKKIIELVEKPKKPLSALAATCIYFFPQDSLKFLDMFLSMEHSPDAAGEYISWLVTQTKVFGYTLKGNWIDIGQRDSLVQAEKDCQMRP